MPEYRVLVSTTTQRWMKVSAPTVRQAFNTNPSQWEDMGDTGQVIDYEVNEVEGPRILEWDGGETETIDDGR